MNSFLIELSKTLKVIKDPEYLYILTMPLIISGLLIGLLIYIINFFIKKTPLHVVSLTIIILSSLLYEPYMKFRYSSENRINHIYIIDSPKKVENFTTITNKWKSSSWKFRLLIVLSSISFILGVKLNKLSILSFIFTILISVLTIQNSIWLHYKESTFYHPNLRRKETPIDKKKSSSIIKANKNK